MDNDAATGHIPNESHRAQMARALVAGEFFLVYQPVLDLSRGSFTGVEALIRWRHDGVVHVPAEFLDELETSGLMTAVGRWALHTACLQGAEWHMRGYRLALSVNLSTTQLRSASLVDDVAIALGTSHLTPRSLVLEITAYEALAPESTTALHALTQLGVRVAVDDFDPTSDSLEAIASRNISLVKLDRHAVARLGSTSEEEARLHELLEEARSLGLAVVATGVEDALQRRILQAERVVSGQGFLFSAPREAHEIDEYLRGFSIFSGDPL